MSWQNWWVVAIVAASKPASAAPSRARRSATTASSPSASSRITGSSWRRAPAGSASARSVATNRPRTRSRSSRVASRPNVTSMTCGNVAWPSAT